MDENSRNGRNWHLAQQITYHVTLYIFQQLAQHVIIQKQQFTQPVIRYVLSSTTNPIPCNHDYHTDMSWGDFYFFYKYQKISPSIQL